MKLKSYQSFENAINLIYSHFDFGIPVHHFLESVNKVIKGSPLVFRKKNIISCGRQIIILNDE